MSEQDRQRLITRLTGVGGFALFTSPGTRGRHIVVLDTATSTQLAIYDDGTTYFSHYNPNVSAVRGAEWLFDDRWYRVMDILRNFKPQGAA